MDVIKKLLEDTGIKGPTELEERSGVDRTTIYKMFSSEGNPSLKTMEQVSEATGKPVADIVKLIQEARAS